MFNISTVRSASASALAVIALSDCVAYGEPGGSYPYPPYSLPHPESYRIPEGHLPPPGECRIWSPDGPPGQQPPPGNCYDLEYSVLPGAFLVRG